jgi:hypothetical protein
MIPHITHFEFSGEIRWGIVAGDSLGLLDEHYPGTADLLRDRERIFRTAQDGQEKLQKIKLSDVRLLSPVVGNKRVICQGANYRQQLAFTYITGRTHAPGICHYATGRP